MGRVQRATVEQRAPPKSAAPLPKCSHPTACPPHVMSHHPPSSPLHPSIPPTVMSPPPSILQWFLLALPAAVLLGYLITAFPLATTSTAVYPSLATLPPESPSWQIYPETYYDGGAYVHFPQGTVSRAVLVERSSLTPRAGPILAHWAGEGRAGE